MSQSAPLSAKLSDWLTVNEQDHAIVKREAIPRWLADGLALVDGISIKEQQFAAYMNNEFKTADGSITSVSNQITMEAFNYRVLEFPIRSPPLLVLLWTLDKSRAPNEAVPYYSSARLVYIQLKFYLACICQRLCKNPNSSDASRASTAVNAATQRDLQAVQHFMNFFVSNLACTKLASKLQHNGALKQRAFLEHYDQTLTELFAKACYEQAMQLILSLELAILHCLKLVPITAVKHGLIRTLKVDEDVSQSIKRAVLADVESIRAEPNAPYSPINPNPFHVYPPPSASLAKYTLPVWYLFETMCVSLNLSEK